MKVEKKATEQVTYDLSAGGVRLCGLPLARVGDEVRVLLQLPRGRGLVRASGRLLRLGETDGQPDFAIQFVHLAPRDEDAIHSAVAKALSEPDRRSILLLEERRSGCDWLRPVTPIRTAVTTSLEAVEYLRKKAPRSGSWALGILGRGPPSGTRCTRMFLGEPSTRRAASSLRACCAARKSFTALGAGVRKAPVCGGRDLPL